MGSLSTIKFGLEISTVFLGAIFVLFLVWFTLADISKRETKDLNKPLWRGLVLFLPGVGAFLYYLLNNKQKA